MEPRPPSRRDTPTIAVPSPSPELNGQGPSGPGSYGTTAPFDPYTAPEAQSAYGPTAGYPGDSATRLGPLADEPVFYPNPGLPPNRPAYQPAARYDARSEYALHPVGRVPPDHQPLNLRPAPPPMAPTLAPPNHNNLIKGILAGVIGLIAVAALVAAFLTFANGGFGGNNDAPPATTAAQVAGQPSDLAAAGVASPSAAPSVTPSGTVSSGAPVVPPASSQAPSPSVDAASGPAAVSDGASAGASASGTAEGDASAQPAASGSARARPGGSAQPSGSAASGGASASGGDIAAFLPPPADLPGGFDAPSNEGGRSLSEVAGTFVAEGEDAAKAQSDLEGWGWQDNQYVVYDAAPQPPDEDVNRYAVSVHQFETAAGATDALPAFVRAFGVDPVELPADTPKIGDDIVAIQTTNPEGNLAVLYVRSGAFVLKIDAASVTGDPLPAALELARQLVG
jgi:hypothetical protein